MIKYNLSPALRLSFDFSVTAWSEIEISVDFDLMKNCFGF